MIIEYRIKSQYGTERMYIVDESIMMAVQSLTNKATISEYDKVNIEYLFTRVANVSITWQQVV